MNYLEINKIYVNKSWSQELQLRMKYVINIWCIRNSDVFNDSWCQGPERFVCVWGRVFKIPSKPPSNDQQINKDKNTFTPLMWHQNLFFFPSSAASMRANTKTSSEPDSSVGFSHLFSVLAPWQERVRRDSLGIRSSFNVRPRVWQRKNNSSSNTHF